MAIWGSILNFYKFARQRHGVGKSLEWQHDLYNLSLFINSGGGDAVLETINLNAMTRLEAKALFEFWKANAERETED